MCKNIDQSLDCCSNFMKVGVIPAIHKLYSANAITNNVCNCTTWPFILFSGWAYIALIACTVLIFMIGMLSIKADKATSKDEIEDEILEGKHLICVKWEARYSCYIYIIFFLIRILTLSLLLRCFSITAGHAVSCETWGSLIQMTASQRIISTGIYYQCFFIT